MKNYVEITRHTATFAQFLAQCRAALRKTELPCYEAWAENLTGAREEMEEISNGKREAYYHKHNADEERLFDEICACSADSYQIYLNRKDDGCFYNFILEYSEGCGYFYCIDGMANEQLQSVKKAENVEEEESEFDMEI